MPGRVLSGWGGSSRTESGVRAMVVPHPCSTVPGTLRKGVRKPMQSSTRPSYSPFSRFRNPEHSGRSHRYERDARVGGQPRWLPHSVPSAGRFVLKDVAVWGVGRRQGTGSPSPAYNEFARLFLNGLTVARTASTRANMFHSGEYDLVILGSGASGKLLAWSPASATASRTRPTTR